MDILPSVSEKPALSFDWFSCRWQVILWRNWGLVPLERLAAALRANQTDLVAAAALLGLDPEQKADPNWLTRGYLTIIRQNWHICTYEQICTLLAISEEQLAFILKEDDFFWHKMGKLKPALAEAHYRPLTAAEEEKTKAAASYLHALLPASSWQQENAFAFLEQFTRQLTDDERRAAQAEIRPNKSLRTVYSYFALYGDPLLTPELDPFPEALLAEYARMGVKGVWLQGILYQLVNFPFAPEMSQDKEIRLANLRVLVQRAARYDIGVYLYFNEPRAMGEAFFAKYPDLRGTKEGDFYAMCSSQQSVQQYLQDAAFELFSQVDGLAGFFTITMSENLTNCYSRKGEGQACPRCSKRKPWEIVAEVNNLLARGAKKANPKARAIAWNWAWPIDWHNRIMPLLTEGQIIQCTSETFLPTRIGGVAGHVVDYTMSLAGPGEHAKTFWKSAQASGLAASAKVQFNNTWEMSAVPWLPVFDQVAEHVQGLKAADVQHLQLSWTLGGYPSPNLKLANQLMDGQGDVSSFMLDWLGAELGGVADKAQQLFSKAFANFPFHIGVLYVAPQNYGPMVPFQLEDTGYKASMIGFPYDNLDGWRAIYPRDIFYQQFAKLTEGWQKGLDLMQPYLGQSTDFDDMWRQAAAAYCHFASTTHQIQFVLERDSTANKEVMRKIIAAERDIVLDLIKLRQEDSRIGYESSNHYYYSLHDLAEKLLNLKYCEGQLK